MMKVHRLFELVQILSLYYASSLVGSAHCRFLSRVTRAELFTNLPSLDSETFRVKSRDPRASRHFGDGRRADLTDDAFSA